MISKGRESLGSVTLASERLPNGKVPFNESNPHHIDVGLINNMPDAALKATERQFQALLRTAADGFVVRLRVFALPDVPRTDFGETHVRNFYSSIDDLWDSHLDGLIVTGTEPRAPNLVDEPYWGTLTRVLDWAEENTYSTICSCLAAHAALLYIDGIGRQSLGDKRFGVFECARVSEHQLTAGGPSRVRMPHSRWNEIPEDALVAAGYRILTRSKDAGVDTFVKLRKSLFVFFQGHPEYEAHSLLLEYRRDIGRFLRGERDTYPPLPQGYFDKDTVTALAALRERALSDRREELLADFPTAQAAGKVSNTWRSAARRLYRNWLSYISAQKAQRLKAG
ncbi:MAG: homoserine O-succinyltransferase [Candidatus Rokuibacteriota bacterium]|nr:MAG: homoserine O-succinyltransferase [Candidatus Rokubacteria bacterium]